jgi:hypothetical protein
LSVLGFYYVDERDYQAAKAEEDRQAWSRTAEGQAQLADLAAKDAARQAAELKRQLEMMETESGRQELANERKVQVAEYVIVCFLTLAALREALASLSSQPARRLTPSLSSARATACGIAR